VTPLQVVAPNTAIRLRAIRDFKEYKAGDEWLYKGPGTYYPSVEVQVVEITKAIIIKPIKQFAFKPEKTPMIMKVTHVKPVKNGSFVLKVHIYPMFMKK